MKGYPKWFSVRLISLAVLALFVSGCLLIPTSLEMRFQLDMPWRLGGGSRIFTAALHALLAFFMCTILGALWTLHMRQGLRKKKNRKSGLVQLLFWGVLVLSGIGLYYIAGEGMGRVTSAAHTSAGLGVLLLYAWHVVAYRRD